MYPTINKLREEGYIVYVFDVDESPETAKRAEALESPIPLTIIYEDGKEVDRIRGIVQEEDLRAKLKTREEQKPVEPAPPEKPVSPYDGIY